MSQNKESILIAWYTIAGVALSTLLFFVFSLDAVPSISAGAGLVSVLFFMRSKKISSTNRQ